MPSTKEPRDLRRRAALTLAAGLCTAAAVAIWALVTGSFDELDARVLISTLAASLCTLAGLAAATVLDRRDYRRGLGQATIALAVLDLALALTVIWGHVTGEAVARSLGVTSALLAAGAHACLMLGRLRADDGLGARALTRLAVACAGTAALLLGGLFALSSGPVAPTVWRALGVLAVLAVLNTLLAPLARRLEASGGRGDAATGDVRPRTRRKRERHWRLLESRPANR